MKVLKGILRVLKGIIFFPLRFMHIMLGLFFPPLALGIPMIMVHIFVTEPYFTYRGLSNKYEIEKVVLVILSFSLSIALGMTILRLLSKYIYGESLLD